MFAIALAVRLLVGAQLADEPLFRSPQLDSLEYYRWAQQIAAGNFLWPVPPPHGLGYPTFLGGLLALFDGSLGAVRAVQAGLGAATCALAAAVGSRCYGRWAGLAAGVLLAVHAPLVWIDLSILAEGLLVFLLVLSWWIISGAGHPSARSVAAGLVLGAAVLVRPTALALLPALVAWCWLESPRGWRRWPAAALLLASFVMVTVPVVWRIAAANGAFVPVQGHSGLAFFIGNHPGGDGLPSPRLGRGWELLESEAARAGARTPAAQDAYYRDRTLTAIAARPGAWLRLIASKALWLVQAAEVRDSHSFEFFRARSAWLRWLPGFGLLFPLAVGGVLAAWRSRRPPPVALLLGLAGLAAVVLFTMVGTRYRLPLVPFLAILAGPAVVSMLAGLRARRRRELAALGAVLAAAWAVEHVRAYPGSLDFAEEHALTGAALETLGDWQAARAAHQRSLEADPRYLPALEGLARIHLQERDSPAAEVVLRRALSIEPTSQRSHYYLALVLQRTGRSEAARAELQASLDLLPNDLATLRLLAPLVLARGEVEPAAELYSRWLAVDGGSALAHLGLARVEGARGRPAEGLTAARRAAALAPANGEAWLVLARLAIDAGAAGEAESALLRAETLIGRAHPQVAAARAELRRRLAPSAAAGTEKSPTAVQKKSAEGFAAPRRRHLELSAGYRKLKRAPSRTIRGLTISVA